MKSKIPNKADIEKSWSYMFPAGVNELAHYESVLYSKRPLWMHKRIKGIKMDAFDWDIMFHYWFEKLHDDLL